MATRAFAGAALVALVAAGCGGHKPKVDRLTCRGNYINGAAYRVVTQAFYDGKLGPRARVARELGADAQQFFDGNGRFRPYASFSGPQKSKINHWMYEDDRVLGLTWREQDRAKNAAALRVDDVCD